MRRGARAPHCGTRQQNPHVTERREVLYPWHPWFGLSVHIHQKIDRGQGANFRCSVDGVMRSQELPVWMFDRVSCLLVRVELSPRVDRMGQAGDRRGPAMDVYDAVRLGLYVQADDVIE